MYSDISVYSDVDSQKCGIFVEVRKKTVQIICLQISKIITVISDFTKLTQLHILQLGAWEQKSLRRLRHYGMVAYPMIKLRTGVHLHSVAGSVFQ